MKPRNDGVGARSVCSDRKPLQSEKCKPIDRHTMRIAVITTDSKKQPLSVMKFFLFGTLFALFTQASWLARLPSKLQFDDHTDALSLAGRNATGSLNASGACTGYDGVLHIAQGDQEGAAGTIFFLFIVNQLIYADMHNLMPWIHLNNVSKYVYDDKVHGNGNSTTTIDFETMCGKAVSWDVYTDPSTHQQCRYPGKPIGTNLVPCRIPVKGNGVWNSYFEPVSNFNPTDPSCTALPLIRMTYSQIIPALHVFAPWSVRAWRYGGLPPGLAKHNETYQDWFAPMRQRGHDVGKKYNMRFLPYLRERAAKHNPHSECLALHVRHSDKANRRKRIPTQRFLPYVEAYYHHQLHYNREFSIYLATDSSKVIETIQETWPDEIQSVVRWQQGNVIRSNDTTAVFKMTSHAANGCHHETNVQVLTDILAMSRCQYLVHGLSAVSEAVHYLNFPHLHQKSVNLDDRTKDIVSVARFQDMLQEGQSW